MRFQMRRRRYTKGLDSKQVTDLTHGWRHAARIACPLNVMVTIRPFEQYDSAANCKLAASIRNKLGVYARQHRFPFVAAWTRECHRDGTGEHLHVLMYVPRKHFADLVETVVGWYPEPGAADVRQAHQRVYVTETGKHMSAIGYIAKQMTPQAWYRRGLIRKGGGPILGKRGGVTRNIGRAAIEQYFAARQAARRQFDRLTQTTLVATRSEVSPSAPEATCFTAVSPLTDNSLPIALEPRPSVLPAS
jgi:hypothetical protein